MWVADCSLRSSDGRAQTGERGLLLQSLRAAVASSRTFMAQHMIEHNGPLFICSLRVGTAPAIWGSLPWTYGLTDSWAGYRGLFHCWSAAQRGTGHDGWDVGDFLSFFFFFRKKKGFLPDNLNRSLGEKKLPWLGFQSVLIQGFTNAAVVEHVGGLVGGVGGGFMWLQITATNTLLFAAD